jgi:hypothetical protein
MAQVESMKDQIGQAGAEFAYIAAQKRNGMFKPAKFLATVVELWKGELLTAGYAKLSLSTQRRTVGFSIVNSPSWIQEQLSAGFWVDGRLGTGADH